MMHFIRREVKIGDGIVVETFRSHAEAPVLVLLPGSFNDERLWTEASEYFTRPVDALVINLQGHGGSRPAMPHSTIGEYAHIVLRTLEEMGIDRFYISGNSIGGMMALEAGRLAPQRVRGIIPCEGWTHHSVLQTAFNGDTIDCMPGDVLQRAQTMRSEVTRNWTQEDMRAFASIWRNYDCYDFLCETRIPILSLWGDRGKTPPTPEQLRIPVRQSIEIDFLHGAPHSFLWQFAKPAALKISTFIDREETWDSSTK